MLTDWAVPILLVDGWHDYPLPGVLADYAILRDAPAPVHLRIGAGGHLGGGGEGGMTDAPLDWFDTYLRDEPGLLLGRARWRCTCRAKADGATSTTGRRRPPPTAWYLHPDGRLATDVPADAARARPLPLRPRRPHAVDRRHRHAHGRRGRQPRPRGRVPTCSCTPATRSASRSSSSDRCRRQLHLTSTLDHVDVFVRVCDVHPDGAVVQRVRRAAALRRPAPSTRDADGVFVAAFALWPIGHRFAAGHRLRIQVSSGSHPVYARNLGTGEPAATAVDMVANDVTVHHDTDHTSGVTLPTST